MRESRKFWQDVDLAIGILLLRQSLHYIIAEGRNSNQPLPEICNNITRSANRVRTLNRYYELMKVRFQNYNSRKPDQGG